MLKAATQILFRITLFSEHHVQQNCKSSKQCECSFKKSAGVFFVVVEQRCSIIQPPEKYTPPAHWSGLNMVCRAASAVNIIDHLVAN